MRVITAPLAADSPHRSFARILITLALIFLSILLILIFFNRFPIENTTLGVDWRIIYDDIQPGRTGYDSDPSQAGLVAAPWIFPVIMPLGYLNFRISWGVVTLATLAILVVSVPTMRSRIRWIAGILVLVTSFPVLRHVADGNLEGLVLAGSLMALHGFRVGNAPVFALGVLLGTVKPQVAWLLMLVLGVFALRKYPMRWWLRAALVACLVAVPMLIWQGKAWLNVVLGWRGTSTIIDMTLSGVLSRAHLRSLLPVPWLIILVITLWLAFRDRCNFSRNKAAMLMAASLLLAPYASGISFVTLFAFGVIPLLQTSPRIGVTLVLVSNAQFLFSPYFINNYGNYYAFANLLLVWLTTCWLVHRDWRKPDTLDNLTP